MNLADYYQTGRFGLSFELFPPKTPAGDAALVRHVEALMRFSPNFITCTYGAGGSTQEKTRQILAMIKQDFGLPVASHLTCVGATCDQLRSYLRGAAEQGVDYMVALRGDPPAGQSEFTPVKGGLQYANELVALIRSEFPQFGIAVAGYPEVHREAPSAEVDLANLRRKVDAGGDIVVTQLFYRNEDFLAFRDRYIAAGIKAPLIPGLLPVTSLSQVQRITNLCGAQLPTDFIARLAERDDPEWQMQVGIEQTAQQVQRLVTAGVPGVHFYVLNKSRATSAVMDAVQLPGR